MNIAAYVYRYIIGTAATATKLPAKPGVIFAWLLI